MSYNPLRIWFYINIDLTNLAPLFATIFETSKLEGDYENVWEWLDGYSNKYSANINIAREHDGENGNKGNYEKPVILDANFVNPLTDSVATLEKIAGDLQENLQICIQIGYIRVNEDDGYEIQEIKRLP